MEYQVQTNKQTTPPPPPLQTAGCALSAPLLAGCYLVFLEIVTVLSGASVLGPNSSPTSLDLSAISSIRTLCRVSLSFSLIPSLGLKTPRKSGSSSGVSGSRWAPTMVIFCCDLGQKYAVRWWGQTCRAVRDCENKNQHRERRTSWVSCGRIVDDGVRISGLLLITAWHHYSVSSQCSVKIINYQNNSLHAFQSYHRLGLTHRLLG